MIGDPAVLTLDPVWNEFLHFIKGMGGWRGVEYELPSLDEDDGNEGDSIGEVANALRNHLVLSEAIRDPELPDRNAE